MRASVAITLASLVLAGCAETTSTVRVNSPGASEQSAAQSDLGKQGDAQQVRPGGTAVAGAQLDGGGTNPFPK